MTRIDKHVSKLVADAILQRMQDGHMTLGEVIDEAVDHVLVVQAAGSADAHHGRQDRQVAGR